MDILGFMVFDMERQKYWTQDRFGYVERSEAGYWHLEELQSLPLAIHLLIVPRSVDEG